MEIGGYDIVFEFAAERIEVLYLVFDAVQLYWENSIIEYVVPGEFFCYKDCKAKAKWDEDIHLHTMIHVLISLNQLTLVVDDPEEETTKKIIKYIKDHLE